MDYSVELAEEQANEGRFFILEQPAPPCTSWQQPSLHRLCQRPDVTQIALDQCRFELRAMRGPFKGMRVKKPTCLATNIEGLGEHVEKKCSKNHHHGMLLGGSAQDAAIYTPSFVKALVNGIKAALGHSALKPKESHRQWYQWGQSLGHIAREEAYDLVELEREIEETYGNHAMSWPTAVGEERDEEEEDMPDAVSDLRRQLRTFEDNPRLQEAMEKVETFENVGVGAFALDPKLRKEVHRVHRNFGHPSREIFLRALRNLGVRDDILSWTKEHFRCSTCEARPRPSPARPGHLMRALEFNQVVGIDLCFLEAYGLQNIILNMLCWGTNFQQASLCRDKSADEVLNVFMNEWIKHYGPPVLLVMDRGKEFDNFKFQELVGGQGTALHYTDPESPWQNSRTERAGGILKEKIQATLEETCARFQELALVVSEVVASRNRFMDRHGFSPMQRVFGKSLRLPASLLATDTMDRELTAAAASDPLHRAWEIREAAMKEWMKKQDQGALKRALKANSRTADLKDLRPGTWVYVFRDSPSYRGWVGPGVLISPDVHDRSLWVSMCGRLWKAAREQLRPATPEEELGAELVVELTREMLDKLHKKEGHNQIAYQDVTAETFPSEEDLETSRRHLRISEQDNTADGIADDEYSPSLPMERETTNDSTQHPEGEADVDMELDSDGATTTPPQLSQPPSRRVSIRTDHNEDAPMLPPIAEGHEPNPIEHTSPVDMAIGEPATSAPRTTIRVDEGPHGTMQFGPAPSNARNRYTPYQEVPETPPVGYTPPARRTTMPFPFDGAQPSLPPPPGASFYIEVVDFDKDEDLKQLGSKTPFIGATWKFNREQGRRTLLPRVRSHGTFSSSQAEASFCSKDRCMYVSKAKSSFGQIEFSKLPEEEKVKFRKARIKEVDRLIKNKAVRALSIEDSIAFEEQWPEQVINSRFVDRFKPKDVSPEKIENYKKKAIDEGHLEALALEENQQNPKSRLCVIGWENPQIMEVERSAPTPLSTSLHCCLQMAASRRWTTRVRDVKTAFLQALPTTHPATTRRAPRRI